METVIPVKVLRLEPQISLDDNHHGAVAEHEVLATHARNVFVQALKRFLGVLGLEEVGAQNLQASILGSAAKRKPRSKKKNKTNNRRGQVVDTEV